MRQEKFKMERQGLIHIGDEVETENGKGTVIGIDILNRKLKVLINDNKEEIELAKIYEKKSKK